MLQAPFEWGSAEEAIRLHLARPAMRADSAEVMAGQHGW